MPSSASAPSSSKWDRSCLGCSVALFVGALWGWDEPGTLAWAAWLAPCVGWYLGARVASRGSLIGVLSALGLLCLGGAFGLCGPVGALWAWAALAGLLTIPFGVAGRLGRRDSASRDAGGIAILGLFLAVAPTATGLLDGGWARHAPRAAGLAMDVSPAVFVIESAQLDALRMPLFYGSDTTDFVMGTRRPWNTPLAPLGLLVLGCALVLLSFKSRTT